MPVYTAQELDEQGKGPTRFDDELISPQTAEWIAEAKRELAAMTPAEREAFWKPKTVEQMYAELGKPEHVGQGFAITVKCLQAEFGGNVENVLAVPAPDYDHALFVDEVTDNILVIRADGDGEYKGCSPDWKRLR